VAKNSVGYDGIAQGTDNATVELEKAAGLRELEDLEG
jgi:hypothetical protein